jgi:hypothetical protein
MAVHFIKKESEKTMEYEWEYLTADTAENCKTIGEWVFNHQAEVMQRSLSGTGTGHWIFTIALVVGKEYRRKKPAPPKVKKLVNREQEDFWPLIGRYWARDKKGKRFLIQNDNWVHAVDFQENWQIAPLGTEEWQPMMIERLVDSE